MNVFVTGGTGRLGRNLVQALIQRGDQVTALSRSSAGGQLGASPVRGDLLDGASLRSAAAGAEQVFHLGGGVRGKGRHTPAVLNEEGTRNLVQALDGRAQKLVLASSAAVYGDRSNLWVEEDFEPSPNTRYGLSKVAAERLVLDSGQPWVIARMAAVYGPDLPFAMVGRMLEGKAWLPGEGRNHVPTIHTDDCIAGLIRVADAGEVRGIYHLADRSQPTLREFYAEVQRVVGGQPVRFWSTYVPSYVQSFIARNNERLASRIGQKPRLTPDTLKLFTNSVRLRTERLAQELDFTWKYPEHPAGIEASFHR